MSSTSDHLPPHVRPAIRAAARAYKETGWRVTRRKPGHINAGRRSVPPGRRLAQRADAPANGGIRAPVGSLHAPLLHAAPCGPPA